MKKDKQIQESIDIVEDEKTVANVEYTVYENGNLEIDFAISDAKAFHESEETKKDLNELIEAALVASKVKLDAYKAPVN